MAAILQPRPAPRSADRPQLLLLPGGRAGATHPAAPPVPWRAVVGVALAVVVAMALAVAVGRGSFAALAPAPAASAPASSGVGTGERVVVEPGDTLWSIARRVQPTGDVRPLVERLVASHGTAALQPGDVVLVP